MAEKDNALRKKNDNFDSPNDRALMLTATYELTSWPKIDYHDPEQVEQRVKEFFAYSAERGLVPLPSTLALALGCSLRAIQLWRSGGQRQDPKVLEILNNAYNLMIANLQMAGLTGKVQVIQALSIQHSMGVQDNPDKVSTESLPDDRRITAAEIRQKYQDMPDD